VQALDRPMAREEIATLLSAFTGETEAARQVSAEAIRDAEVMAHDFTIAFAQVFSAVMYHFDRLRLAMSDAARLEPELADLRHRVAHCRCDRACDDMQRAEQVLAEVAAAHPAM
jgi:hypothetical protein